MVGRVMVKLSSTNIFPAMLLSEKKSLLIVKLLLVTLSTKC